jgi:hypothetical protein
MQKAIKPRPTGKKSAGALRKSSKQADLEKDLQAIRDFQAGRESDVVVLRSKD